ncbi:PH domain-containing protein [Nocardiopsis synnemataformans]|uniref:PH domain-containing protein n=1 Tax=Nocardiopsis synnemataformans TaxID=61305 RepID=UPI003EC0FDC5
MTPEQKSPELGGRESGTVADESGPGPVDTGIGSVQGAVDPEPGTETGIVESDVPVTGADEVPWERLDARMILVDFVKLALALAPAGLALWVFDVEPTLATTWPLALIALFGLYSLANGILRWIKTRYRLTPTHVERCTGLFVRQYRSIQRDRIRSVESEALLRHRLAGLRMVDIGAGQQNTSGESALILDAVSHRVAESLREQLLEDPAVSEDGSEDEHEQVIQDVRYHWVFYNILNGYAYVVAIGLLWGGYWLLIGFGVDPLPLVKRVVDWEVIGWAWTLVIALLAAGVLGVLYLVWGFFNEYWRFRLSRVRGRDGTLLRTTQGLLRTKEVDREDHRMRGVQISEPLLWRWMRIADTDVLTTGLSIWSMAPTILPRGPVSVARRVAADVLQEPSPLEAELRCHPWSALRRRLLWATLVTVGLVLTTEWVLTTAEAAFSWPWWVTAAAVWPVAMFLGGVGYLHLGHALVGRYLVVRGRVTQRDTAALQTRAVSGVTVRQSLLQQRLGLASVSFTTAAGTGRYGTADLSTVDAGAFVRGAAPDLCTPFLEGGSAGKDTGLV